MGDGTTSVIVLAGEMLAAAEQFLEQQMHPTVIIRQYKQALEDIVTLLEGPLSVAVDKNDKAALANVVCIKFLYFTKKQSQLHNLVYLITLWLLDK